MRLARLSRLAALTQVLPFAVDDYDAAREAYVRWRETGTDTDRQPAALWAYCYVTRYFTVKFANEQAGSPSDYDALVEDAVRRVFGAFDEGIDDAAKFPQFVSVVCSRVLISYRERRREHVQAHEEMLEAPTETPDIDPLDRLITRDVVTRAVTALPAAIGEVARMRLLQGGSYEDIASTMDLSIDTVRTYYSKALRRLREDPEVRALWFDDEVSPSMSNDEDLTNEESEVRSGDPPGLGA